MINNTDKTLVMVSCCVCNKNLFNENAMSLDIAMGGSTSIHDAMIAAEKASLSMQMAIQVRNRLISAYTDITSMAI